MAKRTPQAYFVPELNQVIMVETIATDRYCAHFPTGAERVTYSEVREGDWKRVGTWEEYNKEVVHA